MDLDFNGVKAQSDPNELQTPICQAVTEPTQDLTGGDIKHTSTSLRFHSYVLGEQRSKRRRRDGLP